MPDIIQQKGMDVFAERVTELVDFISKKAPGFLVDQAKNGGLILSKGLPDYLEANYYKCETIRTLLKRDSPTFLDAVYQEHTFCSDREVRTEEELHTAIGSRLERTIISGGAGNGKSVFLKRLFRKSIEDGQTYYPIFFEFRSIPIDSKKSLLDQIYQSIAHYSPSFTKKQFVFGLRRGLFYLMLDALDEAPIDIRDTLTDEIESISKKIFKMSACNYKSTERRVSVLGGVPYRTHAAVFFRAVPVFYWEGRLPRREKGRISGIHNRK